MIRELDEKFIFENSELIDKKKLLSYLESNVFAKIIGYFIDDIIVGIIQYSYIYSRIELDYVKVMEKYRNKKIASQLLEYIILNNNVENITLEVKVDNINAIKLYGKYNFKIIKVIKNYYVNKDAYMMMRC